VVDVGCAYGDAMQGCVEKLQSKEFTLNTVGIDREEKVRSKAESVFGRFVSGDTMDLSDMDYNVVSNTDVVILSRVLNYIGDTSLPFPLNVVRNQCRRCRNGVSEKEGKFLDKCYEMLKPTGILLINNYGKTHVKPKSKIRNYKDWKI